MAVKKAGKSTVKKSSKKGSPVKKAAKKTAPPKGTSKKTPLKKSTPSPLTKNLLELAKQLDNEEVAFLIKQAQVFVKNKQIRKRLKETTESVTYEHRTMSAKDFQLPALEKEKIEFVEGKDGSHFIIVVGTERNFFSREEFKKIVALCHVAGDEKDGMRRLYTWFDRNRSDVLKNTDIKGPGDIALATIYNAVINTYDVKG